tara:strand:+ start:4360 stop:4782 length:423 start_codon:yes stop_codon:yes gene_type:complete
MSKIALGLKIDLSKMDMARIFNGKNGAQYLDATIFVDLEQLDQYGNSGMITQDVTKEEKAQKIQGNILGNGNVFWVENGQAPQKANQSQGFQQQAPQQVLQGSQQQPQAVQGFSNQTPSQQNQPCNAPQQPQGGFMPNNG